MVEKQTSQCWCCSKACTAHTHTHKKKYQKEKKASRRNEGKVEVRGSLANPKNPSKRKCKGNEFDEENEAGEESADINKRKAKEKQTGRE